MPLNTLPYSLIMAEMNLTMQVKLPPTPDQATSLLATMQRFNATCGALAAVAFAHRCANKVELQKLAYHDIRAEFGVSAQMTARAIAIRSRAERHAAERRAA